MEICFTGKLDFPERAAILGRVEDIVRSWSPTESFSSLQFPKRLLLAGAPVFTHQGGDAFEVQSPSDRHGNPPGHRVRSDSACFCSRTWVCPFQLASLRPPISTANVKDSCFPILSQKRTRNLEVKGALPHYGFPELNRSHQCPEELFSHLI